MKTIKLTQGKYATVDDQDYDILAAVKWCFNCGYAVRARPDGKIGLLLMHREIMQAPKGMEVDHINGDRLDNRRANLRICTHAENRRNRKTTKSASQYKGVGLSKRDGRWVARIRINYKLVFLGYFEDEIDAAKAYDSAARDLHGEFARTNF